jgi:Tfp pilus assembly protein PilZ
VAPDTTRRYPRLNKLFLLAFVACEEGRQKSPVSLGRIINISQFGIGIEVFDQVPVGSEMEMEIDLHDMIVQAAGRVAHITPAEDGKFIIGIEFKEEQEKLTQHIIE